MGRNSKAKKKGHGAEKTAAKTERKAAKKAKKAARTAGEDDVDAVVAELEAEESAKCRPLVELADAEDFRPSARRNFSWTANPRHQELYLFGGEQRLAPSGRLRVLNEHLTYRPATRRWIRLGGGSLPTPRCAHQAALAKPAGQPQQLFVFGGEFATPTESQFHHYGDLWSWTVRTRQWRKISPASGPGPCPRSGHRMLALPSPSPARLLLFGGFQDNGRAYRYLNDLWCYDCQAAAWTEVRAASPPCPRSACLLFPLPAAETGGGGGGICVLGGYSKRTERRAERGVVHTDCCSLSLAAIGKLSGGEQPQSQAAAAGTASWQPVKFSGQRPTPRCGVSGAVNPATGRAYTFGGVFDIEQADDGMTGVMFNELYQLDLAKQRWRLVDFGGGGRGGDEATAAAATAASVPCERINAGLAVMDDLLYLYGGIYEGDDDEDEDGDGDDAAGVKPEKLLATAATERSRTLDDLHCLNLKRLDAGWTLLLPCSDDAASHDRHAVAVDDADGDEGEGDGDDDDDDDEDGDEEDGGGEASGDEAAEAEAAGAAADADTDTAPPAVAAGESAEAYAERTGAYWSRAVGDSLRRCWSPEDVTEPLVAKYARRAARDFYWQTAES